VHKPNWKNLPLQIEKFFLSENKIAAACQCHFLDMTKTGLVHFYANGWIRD
jgi:hypothetical protein